MPIGGCGGASGRRRRLRPRQARRDGYVRVVAIQGSPHRGNTFDRVERFGEALTALGKVDFEHVALSGLRIEPCRGCFACFTRGEDECPLKDDRVVVEEAMRAADGVVFASPVYSMHVSFLMKTLIDRMAYTFHRPGCFGKYAVALAVTGAVGQKETLAYLRTVARAWGFEYVDGLSYTDPPRGTSIPRFSGSRDRAGDVARRLHRLLLTRPARRLSLNDHLMFHVMRAVYRRMEDFSPADYAYWSERGWLEPGARYFTEHARAGLLKSLYPRALAWFVGRAMDRRIAKLED